MQKKKRKKQGFVKRIEQKKNWKDRDKQIKRQMEKVGLRIGNKIQTVAEGKSLHIVRFLTSNLVCFL